MEIDRLSLRARPPGRPAMRQTWDRLLFLHWAVPETILRPLIPERLHIDTFEGTAWIGLTPFTIRNLSLHGVPALPFLSATHELNVRTYVHLDGIPGVWFFSLDASNPLAVVGARVAFALPYYWASISLESAGNRTTFSSLRRHPRAPEASISVRWSRNEPLPEAVPGSRAFFLVERYCLYAERNGRLSRARIHHRPWPLCRAGLESISSTLIEAHGLPTPHGEPILHAQADAIDVEVWRPERV